ncbi:MAG TPA: CHAT domain-containing protein, partial [Candidatus Polarisedimenticolaceae bacterium]|nr:CHAT domain-containing protein [Candidatus Polarisedimenticolaceae bacterium]
ARAWGERLQALRASFGNGTTPGPGDSGRLLRDLERELWQPLASALPAARGSRVTIVPHGALLLLPFASLIDPAGGYLVESFTLDYAPSIAALDALGTQAAAAEPAAEGCLAIGNPATGSVLPALPGAETEAAFAAAALGHGRGNVLVGLEATEARVRSLAPGRAWLHFATHGVVRDDAPLESALLLAPPREATEGGDGRLTAREILDLRLRARLVTLSACDSGLGRVTGEGMLGLCRSFLHAGAESVVVSLWGVSDLVGGYQMNRFYSSLAEGQAPALALRRAQLQTLEALRRGELRTPSGRALPESPFLWAPYVLIGEGGTNPPNASISRRMFRKRPSAL